MTTDRTPDSVEQLEDAELPNPITDPEAKLTEPGEGFEPDADRWPDDPDREGPPAHINQMPR
jgi:hypothetical protein